MCRVCSFAKRSQCRLCEGGEPRLGPRLAPFDLVRGFLLYVKASAKLLTDKAYLGKIAYAVALSAIVLVALIVGSAFLLYPPIASLVGGVLPELASRGLALLLTLVTGFFLFPVLIMLFLFPVLDPLSRLAEAEALGFEPPPHPRGPIADFWDSLDTGARILVFQFVAWIVCLPLTIFVSPIGLPLAMLASAFFAGFSWIDYPASRRGLRFREKWALAKRHWALLTGFGLAFLLGLLIPFFNLCIVGPAGAVGAADLWFASEKGGSGGERGG